MLEMLHHGYESVHFLGPWKAKHDGHNGHNRKYYSEYRCMQIRHAQGFFC